MRLLHITASPFKKEGGVPVVLKELVHEQDSLPEMTVKVLSLKAHKNIINDELFDNLEDKTFEQYVRDFEPDLAILHSFFYWEFNTPARVLHKLGIPYYIEPHGSFGHEAMRKGSLKKVLANNTVFRCQVKYAKSFIFLNEAEMRDSIYRKDDDIIIPNGINRNKVNLNIGNPSIEPMLYFIGRYDIHHKGLDRLFEALKILDKNGAKLKIMLYGKGNDKESSQIKQWITELNNIQVIDNGSITFDKQGQVLDSKGIMLLTSRYEGFPVTILEALSFGNPSLVTNGTNMADEIEDNLLGWKTGDNPSEIAHSIMNAIEEYKKEPREYIKRCKQYVMENYTWDVIARKSYDVLNEKLV